MPQTTKVMQRRLDTMTFDMYVDCGCDATEAARQLGISRQTVRNRVRRHSLTISADRRKENRE